MSKPQNLRALLSNSNQFPEHPRGQDEHLGALGGHDVGVGDGVGDGNVSVHGDDDQVQDGGGAGPHVHRQPHVAQVLSCNRIETCKMEIFRVKLKLQMSQ